MLLCEFTTAAGKPFVFDVEKIQSIYYEGDRLLVDFGEYKGNRFEIAESYDEAKRIIMSVLHNQ